METIYAEQLLIIVSQDDIRTMFINAKNHVTDWKKTSFLNKSMTIGTSFNILKNATIKTDSDRVIINALREFGDYLPKSILNKIQRVEVIPHHEEPNFDGLE